VVRPGTRLWHRHPAVRAQKLTLGEKAADWLKHWFLGTWIALGLVTVWIAAWIALQRTSISWDLYPFILLNLCLSCLAAIQGIILQISANRGDKVNAVIALHTEDNTDKLAVIARHNVDKANKLAVIAQHNVDNTNKLAAQSDRLLDLQKQQIEMLKSLNDIQAAIDGIQARLPDAPKS
jgi:uncharacterized membrane protein